MASRSGPMKAPAARARESRKRDLAPPLDLGPDAVALPTELAHVLRVALPLASHRQRQAAAGFAVEELIAEPLDAAHVALGPEVGPGEYLAVVVSHDVMAAWAARMAPGRRLVPDVLALPVPAKGCCSMREADGRVLVRRADGTGYATRSHRIEAFWRADGAPQIVLYGGSLPDPLPVSAPGLLPRAPIGEAAQFDLLQGAHARAPRAKRAWGVRLAAVLAVALLAHAGILAADAVALRRTAEAREAALRAAIADHVPGLPEALPLEVALQRAFRQAPAADDGGFLPLLADVSRTLGGMADEVTVRSLSYTPDGGLSLAFEAPDLGTLQRVEGALRDAALAVTSGVATTADGVAQAQLLVREARG